MPSITAAVYDGSSPTTLISALTNRKDPNWLDQYLETGSGALKVHELDAVLIAHPTILAYDNIVRLALDGTDRFAFVIEKPSTEPASQGEEADRWIAVSGRGVLALLEHGVVYPETPLGWAQPTQRTFGFMAMAYDDSAWSSAVQIQRQDDTAGTVTPHWIRYPRDWPDPLAYWIWSSAAAGSAPFMAVGTSYFRKSFTLASDTIVGIFATCDDVLRFWLDDEVIHDNLSSDVTSFGFHDTMRVDRTLKAGTHYIAVEAANLNWTPSSNYAGLICSVIELDPGHGLTTTVIVRSNNTWKAKDYPANPPGMTVGEILRRLVEEAQARGALPGTTLNFSDTLDSNSNAWSSEVNVAFGVGATILDASRTLQEQYVDLKMSPTLVLSAYNKGTGGSDLTGSISLVVGTDFEQLSSDGQGHITNALLVRDQNGMLTERTESTSLASHKRKESYIEMGSAPNETQVQNTAAAVFVEFAYPSVQLTGKVKPTATNAPYAAFKPGDRVKMPNQSLVATATTVISLGVSEDEAGHPIFDVEGMQDA